MCLLAARARDGAPYRTGFVLFSLTNWTACISHAEGGAAMLGDCVVSVPPRPNAHPTFLIIVRAAETAALIGLPCSYTSAELGKVQDC